MNGMLPYTSAKLIEVNFKLNQKISTTSRSKWRDEASDLRTMG